ncbi:MAG: hypothetical protein HRU17_21545 [Polyangiaceae bacterium]|nr:hypothetical protein [Polyangiaceae bacterium]
MMNHLLRTTWIANGTRWYSALGTCLVGTTLLGSLLVAGVGCAPQPKMVANVTVGSTGCPAESLAVFDYRVESRTWRAACKEQLYVCSAVGGGNKCTPQKVETLDSDLAARAALLLKVPKAQRDLFITYDLMAVSWDEYLQLMRIVNSLAPVELADVGSISDIYFGPSLPEGEPTPAETPVESALAKAADGCTRVPEFRGQTGGAYPRGQGAVADGYGSGTLRAGSTKTRGFCWGWAGAAV